MLKTIGLQHIQNSCTHCG